MVSLICFLSSFPFLSYYCCLPQIVFLQHSQICKSLYHHCAVFLVFTSPALLTFPESFVFFCSHCVSRSQLPPSSSAACLHHALKNPICFPTTHKLFQDLTPCALLISLIIPFPKTDSIPFLVRRLHPLDPFACWYKSCLHTSCCQLWQPLGSVLSATPLQALFYLPLESPYLLPAKLFNLGIVLTNCVINMFSFVKCFRIELLFKFLYKAKSVANNNLKNAKFAHKDSQRAGFQRFLENFGNSQDC